MDEADVAWQLTPAGREAARSAQDALDRNESPLVIVERLRRLHAPEQARAALALAEGRRTLASKFSDASHLFFDREAAEQATSETVARHTARRFGGAHRIADLGCGAGADSLLLAEQAPVLAVDLDPGRVALLGANAEARGLSDRIEALVGDVTRAEIPAEVDAVWLDPARRDDSGRRMDPEAWNPPLSEAIAIARRYRRAGIKVAPGIDLDAVPADAEVEFISLDGRLVEAVIWLREAVTTHRRATVLPEGETLAGEPDSGRTVLGDPATFLYDLDPSVGRAGLVDQLAPRLDAWLLDPKVAYLVSEAEHDSPFARRFRIHAWFPFSERQLLEVLRALEAGRVEVMRRASPVETNALEVRLNRTLGGRGRVLTVALTRVAGQHVAIVCKRDRGVVENLTAGG